MWFDLTSGWDKMICDSISDRHKNLNIFVWRFVIWHRYLIWDLPITANHLRQLLMLRFSSSNHAVISTDNLKATATNVLQHKNGKVYPYSLPSVRPGDDPNVQTVSPQVTYYVILQRWAAITFCQACSHITSWRTSPPFDRCQVILLGERSTQMWTTCPRLLRSFVRWELNPQPTDCKSNALPLRHCTNDSFIYTAVLKVRWVLDQLIPAYLHCLQVTAQISILLFQE